MIRSEKFSSHKNDVISAFKDAMMRRDLIPPAQIMADGKIHRCDAEGKRGKSDGSYKLYFDDYPAGGFENHRDAKGWENWRYDVQDEFTDAERKAYRQKVENEQKLRSAEQKKQKEAIAIFAQAAWEKMKPEGKSPYLTYKGIGNYGLRFDYEKLVIPLCDEIGKMWSYQKIRPCGQKQFLKGGRKKGCCHIIGALQGASLAYVVEGYATGASVHLATGKPIIVAFDADNLEPVIAAIRKVYPSLRLIIAADDDRWPDTTGKISHKGAIKAKAAAEKHGCTFILPQFDERHANSKPTDFNDLHILKGIESVTQQLSENVIEEKLSSGLKLQLGKLEDVKSDHIKIALEAIEFFGSENLIFCRNHFYLWNGSGFWEVLDDREIKKLIARLAKSFEKLKKSDVDSILDFIRNEQLHSDSALNPCSSNIINCKNGELHFVDDRWLLRKHKRENYFTYQIPLAYDPEAQAPRFTQFLQEIFDGDEDCIKKMQVLLEMMGYTLLTTCKYERFIILVGNGANGKSVMLSILTALIGERYISAITPSQFSNRFQLAHLAGKMANIVTEISQGTDIEDGRLKAIVSGETITAEHKHKTPFEFRPYATCWFGTNHMPSTTDYSNAIFRRAIILSFNRKFEGKDCDPNLTEKLLNELSGIFTLALHAIGNILAGKQFSEPASSLAAKADWKMDSDPIGQFIEEQCVLDVNARVASDAIYKDYKTWAENNGHRIQNKNKFTSRLKRQNIEPCKGTRGVRLLQGITLMDMNKDK